MSTKRPLEEGQGTNTTLYITNLCTHTPRDTIQHCLYLAFATYAVVILVHVRHGFAHILLDNPRDAGLAMRLLQSESMLGKPMKIEHAHHETKRSM